MFRSEERATASERVTRRPDHGGRSPEYGTKGTVACEHPSAAVAGIQVLDAGGTAADACVAMAADRVPGGVPRGPHEGRLRPLLRF
jgi:gamma-glutamyltranspeptidase/glutathione hydrolase